MRFDSFSFGIFMALLLPIWYSSAPFVLRKILLLIASCLFYGMWDFRYLPLILVLGLLDYVFGLVIAFCCGRVRECALIGSVTCNLFALFMFKYYIWIVNDLIRVPISASQYSVFSETPLALSFTVFISLSYIIDLYKNRISCCYSILDFMIMIMFFPHLNSGPIIRGGEFLPQIAKQPKPDFQGMFNGTFILICGIFAKVVLTDNLAARFTDRYYENVKEAVAVDAIIGLTSFSWQILFDFLGYSVCAIGAAKLLGIDMPNNFEHPYLAKGFQEFWHRWHISLSRWLRDYLYIPLGGNKFGEFITCRNLMITMLLGGLWHGASLKFLIWGLIHGILLALERILKFDLSKTRAFANVIWTALTFMTVTLLWVLFRANNNDEIKNVLNSVTRLGLYPVVFSRRDVLICLLYFILCFCFSVVVQRKGFFNIVKRMKIWQKSMVGAVLSVLILLCPKIGSSFIYFQF